MVNKKEFEEIVISSKSKSDLCRKLNISTNGSGYEKVDKLAKEFEITSMMVGKKVEKLNKEYWVLIPIYR